MKTVSITGCHMHMHTHIPHRDTKKRSSSEGSRLHNAYMISM